MPETPHIVTHTESLAFSLVTSTSFHPCPVIIMFYECPQETHVR